MAYLTIAEARAASVGRSRVLKRTASQILNEEVARAGDADAFDIFLSHSMRDAELIVGVKTLLEQQGHSVYVDWLIDKGLDRGQVTPGTADVLRRRMRSSASLFFATSESSPTSKWMPWELGYFDGHHDGKVAVLPLVLAEGAGFAGQEYLGLYPVVETLMTNRGIERFFVTKGKGTGTYMDPANFRAGATDFKTYR